ncbi:histidine kinase, partial [Pseudomonas sp. FW305-130]
FIHVTSDSVVKGIAEVANKNHITQIVVGESKHSRWDLLIRGSLTQQLVQLLKNVDLHIISTDQKAAPSRL